jgi:para-nitrobenzyl esterase
MRAITPIFVISIVLLLASCKEQKNDLLDPVVQTRYGQVRGVETESKAVTVFKGIPYAKPPVGELRWREPQAPESWGEQILDASSSGCSCMQKKIGSHLPNGPWTEECMVQDSISEDCLYLNIWTPARSNTDKLGVLVYFHGGAFNEGSGSIAVYDGEELAKKGIIVVTINYRLGIMGFFSHPELTLESPVKASGNYGILDCIAAVKWVKENIENFGGDPARITISGQSAGSSAVHVLTASPLAKGLFSGAIAVSGSGMSRLSGGTTLAEAEKNGYEFSEKLGKDLAGLRQMTAGEIYSNLSGVRFSTVIDGYVLPDKMITIFERGEHNDVVTMTGSTADDAGSPLRQTTSEKFKEETKRQYADRADAFLAIYPAENDEQANHATVQSARDRSKAETFKWATFKTRAGKTPVYTYYFDQAIPWPEHPEFGAFHTGDVPYYFNNLKMIDRPWTAADTLVAETASSYWANFVKSGNPNNGDLPEWPAFDSTRAITLVIGAETGSVPIMGDKELGFFIER